MGLFEEGSDTIVTYFKRGTIANDLRGGTRRWSLFPLGGGGGRTRIVALEDAADGPGGRHDDGILED